MLGIHEVKVRVAEFLQNELGQEPEAFRFLKLAKSDGGWEGTVEVTELNEYLKKLGYPPIFDKNRYAVALDENLNVIRYGREEEEE
ncbi:MAG: hypothetical protein QME66_00650 [Candidatus Eisenbacteria bacterium]|nr:hypothetical protein [Candidatus Eisenbacteria bacterium]